MVMSIFYGHYKLYLFADQKASLILFYAILLRKRVPVADYTVVTNVAVTAGAEAYEGAVDLLYPEEVRVTHQWQHMKQIMFLREFRIGTLREMISRDMIYLIIRFLNTYESCGLFDYVTSVAVARLLEDLIYQSHITRTVKIEYLAKRYKRSHEQIRNKVL